jgi:hypothetical protein
MRLAENMGDMLEGEDSGGIYDRDMGLKFRDSTMTGRLEVIVGTQFWKGICG